MKKRLVGKSLSKDQILRNATHRQKEVKTGGEHPITPQIMKSLMSNKLPGNSSQSDEDESSDYLDNPIQATTTIDDEIENVSKTYLQHGKKVKRNYAFDPIKDQDTGYIEFANDKFQWLFGWFFVNDVAVTSLLHVNNLKPGHMRKMKEQAIQAMAGDSPIDRFSRMFFPFSFFAFNWGYWTYYVYLRERTGSGAPNIVN